MPSLLDLIVDESIQKVIAKNLVYDENHAYLKPTIVYRADDSILDAPNLSEIAAERLNDIRDFNLYQPDDDYNIVDLNSIDVSIIDSFEIFDHLQDRYDNQNSLNKYGNISFEDVRNIPEVVGTDDKVESYEDFMAPIIDRYNRCIPAFIDHIENNIGIDTELGKISTSMLINTVSVNLQDNFFQQTVGRLNTDVFGLIQGESLIREDFNITIPRTIAGQGADIASRLLGLQLPFCYIPPEAFAVNFNSNLTSEDRINILLEYTGKAYQKIIINNFDKNKYNPYVEDNLKGNYYIGYDETTSKFNAIKIFTEYDTDYLEFNENFEINIHKDDSNLSPDIIGFLTSYNINNEDEDSSVWKTYDENEFSENTLLYNTKKIFLEKNGISFLDQFSTEYLVNNGNKNVKISKGSSITSLDAFTTDDFVDMEANDYFRVFNKKRKYNKLSTTLRHRGLDNGDTRSVLGENGLPFIAPTRRESTNEEFKNFMFSISNFAWKGNSADIPNCEKYISPNGETARQMWFAPYDIKFSETSTQKITETDFFGRPEPIYTSNNSKRTATLSFAMIIDHPDIINNVKGEYNHIWERYFKGDKSVEDLVETLIKDRLSPTDQETINNIKSTFKPKNVIINDPIKPNNVKEEIDDYGDLVNSFYFPNEYTQIMSNDISLVTLNGGYENGDGVGLGKTYLNGKIKTGKEYLDRTDNGLNQSFYVSGIQEIFNKIVNLITEGKKEIAINVLGYASAALSPRISNDDLATDRANNMITYIQQNIGSYRIYELLESNGVTLNYKSFSIGDITDSQTIDNSYGDEYISKISRKVEIYVSTIVETEEANNKIDDKINDPNYVNNLPNNISPIIDQIDQKISERLFFDKCEYFKFLEINNPIFYDTISQNIEFFTPSYHSYTPQNFNERLTFLQQCLRSSNNIGLNGEEATNFSYGYQPVVYLSLGDWFRTKAFITNLTIDYNAYDLIWDLNPESGAGVQPMIANISLSLEIIGGQTMSGALNRLQTALSFNYYSNTEMYDSRSDSISIESTKDEINSNIIEGIKLSDFIKEDETKKIENDLNLIQDQGIFLDNQINFDGSNLETSTLNDSNVNDLLALKQLLKL